MYFRCQLIVNGIYYEATDDLKNWDDFELSYKRPDYDGVLRSFSTKFEFVNRAYSLLTGIYRKNYLNAEAGIAFYRRNNSWNWEEVFRCALDFSTYSEDGYTVSINAIDDSLAALIKAKRGIQYEYSVDGIKDANELYYDRMEFESRIIAKPDNATNTYFLEDENFAFLPVYIQQDETTKDGTSMSYSQFFQNTQFKEINQIRTDENCLVEAFKNIDVNIDLSFIVNTGSNLGAVNVAIVKIRSNGSEEVASFSQDNGISGRPTTVVFKETVSLQNGEKLAVMARLYNSPYSNSIYITGSNPHVNMIWRSIGAPANIPVISASVILNRLLQSMNSGNQEYVGKIMGSNERLDNTRLLAAESIRNIPHAKLYTSFNKFCEWMEAEFGYVYTICGNNVIFKHRNEFFQNMLSKELGNSLNDYQYSVNSSLIYSSVRVGYEKKDYESINGRDEFRFTNTFSTGLKLTDNTLSLISPYRADAYGIEFLAQKRGEDTTDSESDNDVFMVSVRSDGAQYILNRPYRSDQLSGLISPETMFNFEYSPRFMLEANKSYIGSSASLLQFTSSDGNSDVSINGVKETDDFPIDKGLFTVGEVEISSGDIELPQNLSGYVSFIYNGQPVMGYIKQVKINVGKYEAAKYTLIAKSEEAPEPGI